MCINMYVVICKTCTIKCSIIVQTFCILLVDLLSYCCPSHPHPTLSSYPLNLSSIIVLAQIIYYKHHSDVKYFEFKIDFGFNRPIQQLTKLKTLKNQQFGRKIQRMNYCNDSLCNDYYTTFDHYLFNLRQSADIII